MAATTSGPFGPASFGERVTLRRRAALLRRVREELLPGPGVRLLDLGGGTGATTERFGAGAAEIVVLDPDPRKVARGRRVRPQLGFVEGVAEQIPYESGRFDRVVSLMSFHHFRDSTTALAEVFRVLSPAGWVVVCDFEPSSRRTHWLHFLHGLTSHAPLSFATAEEVEQRARAAGFTRVRRETLGITYLVRAAK
jgi:ubiquinone/menaquinone biosynthesis C-methylase UbiE